MAKRKGLVQSVTVTDVTTFCCRPATEDASYLALDVRAATFVAMQELELPQERTKSNEHPLPIKAHTGVFIST